MSFFLIADVLIWLVKYTAIAACLYFAYKIFLTGNFFQASPTSATSATSTRAVTTKSDVALQASVPQLAGNQLPRQDVSADMKRGEMGAQPDQTPATQFAEAAPATQITAEAQEAIDGPAKIVQGSGVATWDTIGDKNSILSQPPALYTIQFGASPNRHLLVEQARLFVGNESPVIYVFSKTRSNRPIFGLSRGFYPSLESAAEMLEQMPDEIKAFKPWIRPLGELQAQIIAMEN